jgi:IS5 family transposase
LLRQIKRAFDAVRRMKHSTAKNPDKKAARADEIKQAHRTYVELCADLIPRVTETVASIDHLLLESEQDELRHFKISALHQMDLIHRRVLNSEKVPHQEKIHSIFETYTEWLSKGKLNAPVELGKNICIVEGNHGFILHVHVMDHEADSAVAVPIMETVCGGYTVARVSMDKGFYSGDNVNKLSELVDVVVVPRKGRLSIAAKEEESSEDFRKARRQHSAVESAINALEHSGLDRCPDRGYTRFCRYVWLGVIARNLQTLGRRVQEVAIAREKRQKRKAF